ncbi:mannose-6-phosphate isomerase [Aureimonas sp. Leaf454]|uniref:AGE family epimerase/isomerase n=1 Tax=Aureimonas sp. Leaf454 TaxID=1736381 RepID=UPI0006F4D544|nr:AGE family epimerase/isomerase [Aureimonas sp. Leaf454]KQT47367.1 mannose-6-phosphate isomerase [Aureimonas sp. Leaf454]
MVERTEASSPSGDRLGTPGPGGVWRQDETHRRWLAADAERQFAFFRKSLRADGGFDVLDRDGTPFPDALQELHSTTRLVHSYALGKAFGLEGADAVIDGGMDHLWNGHRDDLHGGYAASIRGREIVDGVKLAYGHVFVLLAAASAKLVGHPDADRLLADAAEVLDRHYWDEATGLFRDEFNRDWTPFSTYRGMNANMHGVEALVTAYEATGETLFLDRAGRILDFFVGRIGPAHGLRLPEHYNEDWTPDPDYRGNPMFRPAGTTPGHSFELSRLTLQHWDLAGRRDAEAPARARRLFEQAFSDAWREADGGFVYTVAGDGRPLVSDRYWWPVTEAIGALSALMKLAPQPADEERYRRLWRFADRSLIDHEHGGWFPEIDDEGRPVARQFAGKPDIYHSVQATLLPLVPGLSRLSDELRSAAARR